MSVHDLSIIDLTDDGNFLDEFFICLQDGGGGSRDKNGGMVISSSKKERWKIRRGLHCIFFLFVTVITTLLVFHGEINGLSILVGGVGTTGNGSIPSNENGNDDVHVYIRTSMYDLVSLRQSLLPISGHALFDTSSDQYKALEWLAVSSDARKPSLEEAYIIALLYFATSGSGWKYSYSFMNSSKSICHWNNNKVGFFCDPTNTSISKIELRRCNLTGTIPSEISYLSSLEELHFEDNNLRGTLPTEIGLFSNMHHFSLENNLIHGTIPTEFGNIGSKLRDGLLLHFSIFDNKLIGTIPTEIANLPANVIDLSENLINGTIPTDFSKLSHIHNLDLGRTRLTGQIPTELGDLKELTILRLEENQFTGTLPSEFGKLSLLELLRVDNNLLHGTIPSHFNNLSGLRFVNLHDNGITGDLTSIFCQSSFKDLVTLRADSYCFGGANVKVSCDCCCCRCRETD